MNAYEIPNLRFSLPAGGAVARCRFVSVNTDGNGIQANATSQVIGASMNLVTDEENTAGGHIVEIADGIVMVEASAAITAGAAVYSSADGKAAATGTVIAGVAITGATGAGQLVAVKIK
jgi:hypothetical protein